MRTIEYIVCHHSANTHSTVESVIHWHTTHPAGNGWDHCGYHYIIDKKGTCTNTLPIERKGIHVRGYNSESIGICCLGHFDQEVVSGGQMGALRALLSSIKDQFPYATIVPHSYLGETACPGYNLKQILSQEGLTNE